MATPDQLQKLAQQSTYLTEKSSASVLKDGFDRAKLARELATSIKIEATRQKIDDTKKRAITTARDYNEFKNMVLMADQKPVTTKEMQNFGSEAAAAGQHHGRAETNNAQMFSRISGAGKPESQGRTSRSAKRRQGRRRKEVAAEQVLAAAAAGHVLGGNGPAPPASHIDFARDWERHGKTDAARLAYLMLFGPPAVIAKVLRPCLDFMLLGTVLGLFEERRAAGALGAVAPVDGFAAAAAECPPGSGAAATAAALAAGTGAAGAAGAAAVAEGDTAPVPATAGASREVRKVADFLLAFTMLDSLPGTLKMLGAASCLVGARLARHTAAQLATAGDNADAAVLLGAAKQYQAAAEADVAPKLPQVAATDDTSDAEAGEEGEEEEEEDDGDEEEDDDSTTSSSESDSDDV